MAAPLLVARNLGKSFGRRTAVRDVSLDLRPGETLALVGPNGAGKTTTLRLLAGLLAPTTGTVELGGTPVTHDSASRRAIGFLTEAPGLWDRLTVRENLAVYADLYELAAPRRCVDLALERFGILDRAEDLPPQLSKGLRQRVAIARALLHNPEVVLLDEPTSGLDPESARGVRELVRTLAAEGRAVLVCSHNLDEVDRVASRVAVLSTRLLALDTPGVLRARFGGRRVRVRVREEAESFAALLRSAGVTDVQVDGQAISLVPAAPLATVPDIVRLVVEAGAHVEEVADETPGLEDVYLRLLETETRA